MKKNGLFILCVLACLNAYGSSVTPCDVYPFKQMDKKNNIVIIGEPPYSTNCEYPEPLVHVYKNKKLLYTVDTFSFVFYNRIFTNHSGRKLVAVGKSGF